MVELLSAEEARQVSQANKEELEKELQQIKNWINEEALLGKFKVNWMGSISKAAKAILELKGYTVLEGGGFIESPEVTVLWESQKKSM